MTKRLRQFVLFLMIGTLINVLVAWGAMVTVKYRDIWDDIIYCEILETDKSGEAVEWVEVEQAQAIGWEVYAWYWRRVVRPSRSHPWIVNENATIPKWAQRTHQAFTAGSLDDAWLHVIASGWPCLSLCYDKSENGTSWAITRTHINGRKFRSLPLRPIWSGFLINTLFYALLLWLPIVWFQSARRTKRRRRNQCEQCGYPRGESDVCSECGKQHDAKRRNADSGTAKHSELQ